MPKLLSKYQRHKMKWSDCQLCDLCHQRKNVVLARGDVPCEVLFIGEAPGAGEDVIGQPFIGPAGKLLDQIIQKSDLAVAECKVAFTNIVSCIPKGDDGNKTAEPDKKSIKACAPRLQEFIDMCLPMLQIVVMVGTLSEKWCPRIEGVEYVSITHPAAILRMKNDVPAQFSLAVKRCIATLDDVASKMVPF